MLTWLEASLLGEAVRGAGIWSYAVINLLHILGIATLFGAILVLDLRLLGWRRQTALAGVIDLTVPIAGAGFCLAVLAGICLLASNGSDYIGNPFLLIKFAAIGVALLNIMLLSRSNAWRLLREGSAPEEAAPQLAIFGGVSLLAWLLAISAGRMIAYW